MMEAVRTSETSIDNHFTRQYNPEDNSEHPMRVSRFSRPKNKHRIDKCHLQLKHYSQVGCHCRRSTVNRYNLSMPSIIDKS
jgi:hypothetical protein